MVYTEQFYLLKLSSALNLKFFETYKNGDDFQHAIYIYLQRIRIPPMLCYAIKFKFYIYLSKLRCFFFSNPAVWNGLDGRDLLPDNQTIIFAQPSPFWRRCDENTFRLLQTTHTIFPLHKQKLKELILSPLAWIVKGTVLNYFKHEQNISFKSTQFFFFFLRSYHGGFLYFLRLNSIKFWTLFLLSFSCPCFGITVRRQIKK